MSSKILGLPPRVALRIKDSATGSYPTIARTGDSRTGAYAVHWNDINAISFVEHNDPHPLSVREAPLSDLTLPCGAYQKQDNLVFYHQFETIFNNSTASDSSGNGHHATGSVDIVLTSDTPLTGSSRAFSDDGSNQLSLTIPDSADLSFGNGTTDSPFSIVGWVKRTVTTTFRVADKWGRAANGDPGTQEWELIGNNRLTFSLNDESTDEEIAVETSSDVIPLFRWVHVAATYDGGGASSGMKIYVEGKNVAVSGSDEALYTAMENTVWDVKLGGLLGGYGSAKLDEVALFDVELTPKEIAQIAGLKGGLSMPVGLPAKSLHLPANLVTSLFVSGNVVKGVSDSRIQFTPGEDLTPFIEDSLFEQDQTKNFYTTGSVPSDTGLGFSTPLKSKTQIKFRLPVTASTILSAQTSSIYYYNNTNNGWERIREDLDLAPTTDWNQYVASAEARLFTLFGNMTLSGTYDVFSELFGTPDENSPGQNTDHLGEFFAHRPGIGITKTLFPHASSSISITDSRYAATEEQLIIPNIQHPFLVEKVVVKLPVECGPGWLNDRTTAEFSASADNSVYSYGGPAITFAMQRQVLSNRREVIFSGTIIPAEDNISASFLTAYEETSPQGFLCFGGTPSAVLTSSTGFFTGSALMEITPAISNGMISVGRNGYDNEWDDDINYGALFTGSIFISIDPIGRAGDGRLSGRSFFGKEFISPGCDNTKIRPLYEDSFITQHIFYAARNHAVAPYLLLPGDKVFFSLSKSRPVHDGTDLVVTQSGGTLTGSHDIKLASGQMNITLYGSLVRNQIEHHDTLNQPLTSDAIHETIHELVRDQFDVEDRSVFSGSYIAEIVEGNLNATDQSRKVVGSVLNRRGGWSGDRADLGEVSGSLVRGRRLFSSSERFYDTLVPSPEDVQFLNEGDILNGNGLGMVFLGHLWGYGSAKSGMDGFTDNNHWMLGFPFAPRYASLTRGTHTFEAMKTTKQFIAESAPRELQDSSGSMAFKASIYERETAAGITTTDTVFNTIYADAPTSFRTIKIKYYGMKKGSKFVNHKANEEYANGNFSIYYDAQIRGFKYGLLNCLQVNSSVVYRRDRYGQFRDMLEQRKDSKFQNIEGVTFAKSSPIQVAFSESDPEDTFCSNMSQFATSSQPFFEGESRNRGPLPDVEAIQFSP